MGWSSQKGGGGGSEGSTGTNSRGAILSGSLCFGSHLGYLILFVDLIQCAIGIPLV